nr:elicitin-like protein [Pythium porphyrae]
MSAMRSLLAAVALLLTVVSTASDGALAAPSSASDASTTATNTTSTECDSQLLFQKLYVLMPAINQCAMESDYFIKPSNLSLPSAESLAKFCSSQNCSQLSVELDDAGLPSCTVPVGNTTMPFKVFFKNIKEHCEAAGGGSQPNNDSSSSDRVVVQWKAAFFTVVLAVVTMSAMA